MPERLDHRDTGVAEAIYTVFQLSYAVEAELVGSDDFPPLRRTSDAIRNSTGAFCGIYIDNELVAVAEFSESATEFSIDSLVVSPAHFRKGLASMLMASLLERRGERSAVVETASANTPAIRLYERAGFRETRRWLAESDIEKVQLRL